MKALKFFSYYSFFLLSFSVNATNDFPSELDPQPARRIVVVEDKFYASPELVAKTLLLDEKKNRRTNHFCLVGYAWSDGNEQFWVHWTEEQRLILWRGNSNPEWREKGLIYSYLDLKLGRDTVEKPEDIGGSNYLTTRAWWESIRKDCAAHGQKFTIKPFTEKIKKKVEE
jgi:hypothetical protein